MEENCSAKFINQEGFKFLNKEILQIKNNNKYDVFNRTANNFSVSMRKFNRKNQQDRVLFL